MRIHRSAVAVVFASAGLLAAPVLAQDAYDPPANYYNAATGTGATLKAQLHTIISTGVTVRTYDVARQALALIDVDPNNPSNLIVVYTGASVPSAWDAGVTWNREHTWPDSLGLNGSGPDYSDLHQLRPCNPSVNSSRGNDPFGTGSGAYWDPDALTMSTPYRWRGEMARTMFYADTRYDGTEASTVNLTLVNGLPGANQMGDLASLLEWHYAQPPTDRERRRNHVVYSSVANPIYFQGNRNPFVDHPEYVWTIFGTGPNTSQLTVSSSNVVLGPVITGAPLPTQNITLNKAGSTPTTFDISLSGNASSAQAGPRQAFVSGAGSRSLTVGLATSGIGAYSGTLVVDNTDLTSAAAGQGSQDPNDTVTISGSILAHAAASLGSSGPVVTDATIDFGVVRIGSTPAGVVFTVRNAQPTIPAAALDIDSIVGAGDVTVLTTTLAPTLAILQGSGADFTASCSSSVEPGVYSSTYTILTSDQNLPGATAAATLTLTLNATVACVGDFNADLFVDAIDYDGFINAWLNLDLAADINADEFVDAIDYDTFITAWLAAC